MIGTPEVVACGTENAGFVNIVRKGTKFERRGPFLLRNKVNVLFCLYRNIAKEAKLQLTLRDIDVYSDTSIMPNRNTEPYPVPSDPVWDLIQFMLELIL